MTLSWLKQSKLAPLSLKKTIYLRQLHLFQASSVEVSRCASDLIKKYMNVKRIEILLLPYRYNYRVFYQKQQLLGLSPYL
jgi:hypothetical protein